MIAVDPRSVAASEGRSDIGGIGPGRRQLLNVGWPASQVVTARSVSLQRTTRTAFQRPRAARR